MELFYTFTLAISYSSGLGFFLRTLALIFIVTILDQLLMKE